MDNQTNNQDCEGAEQVLFSVGEASRPPEEAQLAQSFRSGDEKGFLMAVQWFEGSLRRQAVAYLGNRQAAEDAVQETFLRAFCARTTLKGDRVFPWLSKILHNFCMDILRRQKVLHEASSCLFDFSEVESEKARAMSQVVELLADLSPEDRELLHLRVTEKLPYETLAEITGLAVGTLRNRVSKLLRILRERMTNDEL